MSVPGMMRQYGQNPERYRPWHPGALKQGIENTKKAAGHNSQPLIFVMVRPKRFELLAYRFVACCSIQLSYERMFETLRYPAVSVKKK